jgi:hypothetical protein
MNYRISKLSKPLLFVACSLLIIMLSCSKDNTTNPAANQMSYTIDNIQNPILNPMDTVVINGKFDGFNDSTFAVRAAGQPLFVLAYSSDKIIVIAPIHGSSSSKSFEITITKADSTAVSNSKSISVAAFPSRYSEPGKLATEVVTQFAQLSAKICTTVTNNIRVFVPAGVDSALAVAALKTNFSDVGTIFGDVSIQIQAMPTDQKRILDGLIVQVGLDSLLKVAAGLSKRMVVQDHRTADGLLALDGLSAILTEAKSRAGLISTVALIVTPITGPIGGTVALVAKYVKIGLNAIDKLVDAFLPCDLTSMSPEFPSLNGATPYNNSALSIVVQGTFTTQSDPVNAAGEFAAELLVEELTGGIAEKFKASTVAQSAIKEIGKAITNRLLAMGLKDQLHIAETSQIWKTNRNNQHPIDPTVYPLGEAGVVKAIAGYFGLSVEWPKVFDIISYLTGRSIRYSSNVTVDWTSGILTTNGSGPAYIEIDAFAFKPGLYEIRTTNPLVTVGSSLAWVRSLILPSEVPTTLVEKRLLFDVSTSAAVTAPVITVQPQSQTVTAGQSVTFSVTATGTAPLSYQWYIGSTAISGANSSSYSISNVQAANAGTYTVTVSNGTLPNATSDAAVLTVNPAPVAPSITVHPQSQTLTAGQNVTFSVTATGTAPLSYQWYKGGAAISGATASSYSISNVQTANAGTYTVTVSNGTLPNATSNGAVLIVNAVLPTNGLMAHYPFTGTANDASGNGKNGIVNGAIPTSDRFGNSNSAYSFNGTNYIDIGNWGDINDITVSLWSRADSVPSAAVGYYWIFGGSDYGNKLFEISSNITGGIYKPYYLISRMTANSSSGYLDKQVTFKQWHHIVLTRSGQVIKMFLDGDTLGTMVPSPDQGSLNAVNVGQNLYIGTQNSAGTTTTYPYGIKGAVDDVRIYNRAITGSEVQALYHEGGWTGN